MRALGFQAIDGNSLGKIAPVLEKYGCLYDAQFERDASQAVLGRAFVENLKEEIAAGSRSVWVAEGSGPGRAIVITHQSDWDTDFFGLRMERLDYLIGSSADAMDVAVRQYLQMSLRSGVRQISSRVNVRNIEAAQALLRNGFMLVGTKAILRNTLQCIAEFPSSVCTFRPFCDADMNSVCALAGSEADGGRFANDDRFDTYRVRQMYERWVRDHCAGHGDQVLIAEADGKVAGFFAFTVGIPLYGAPDVANLRPGIVTHVAVDRLFRGQGLGKALLMRGLVQIRSKGSGAAYATTAFGNVPSLAAFQSAGFRVLTGHWEFHWWHG
jgi:GNAT superfamily N-acetyltransferase